MKQKSSALSHPSFFNRYVDRVEGSDIRESLSKSFEDLNKDLIRLKEYDFSYSYAFNKWSIATLIRHCIDTEIIFLSRALMVARNEKKPIQPFDENEYAEASLSDHNKEDLISSLLNIRKASVLLYGSFKEEWLASRSGKMADGSTISLMSIGHIIIGHWLHHKKVLNEKYGIQFDSLV